MNQLNSIVNQSLHAKTHSLPSAFEHAITNGNKLSNSISMAAEMSLPYGWTCEKTPTGKIYFMNHITKTTQWEDPRLAFNKMPAQNPGEINNELKNFIKSTIALPSGWEETKTANGEVFYINHNNKQTQWEDPRIAIYMQQEYEKLSTKNQQNSSLPYNTNSNYYLRSNLNTTQSISSSSISSTSSSASSLSLPHQNSPATSFYSLNTNPLQSTSNKSNIQPGYNSKISCTTTNELQQQNIATLKNSLELLSKQKASITSQLEELSKKEISLRSKLNSSDLEDVLRMLKTNDHKISSFDQFEKSSTSNSVNLIQNSTSQQNMSNAAVKNETDNMKIKSELNKSNLNNSSLNSSGLNASNADMDSTLVLQ